MKISIKQRAVFVGYDGAEFDSEKEAVDSFLVAYVGDVIYMHTHHGETDTDSATEAILDIPGVRDAVLAHMEKTS